MRTINESDTIRLRVWTYLLNSKSDPTRAELQTYAYGPHPDGASPRLRAAREANFIKVMSRARLAYAVSDTHGLAYMDTDRTVRFNRLPGPLPGRSPSGVRGSRTA